MVYFLKKSTSSKKRLYLQIYKSFYVPGVGKRNKSFKTIGYVSDLIASGIEDPVSYYQKEESIYGHFLICYLALAILRLL